jgi:hypothetical protein
MAGFETVRQNRFLVENRRNQRDRSTGQKLRIIRIGRLERHGSKLYPIFAQSGNALLPHYRHVKIIDKPFGPAE